MSGNVTQKMERVLYTEPKAKGKMQTGQDYLRNITDTYGHNEPLHWHFCTLEVEI